MINAVKGKSNNYKKIKLTAKSKINIQYKNSTNTKVSKLYFYENEHKYKSSFCNAI